MTDIQTEIHLVRRPDRSSVKVAEPRPLVAALWETLAKERQMTSLIDQEVLAHSGSFARDTHNWVPAWVDYGNERRSDCGTMKMYRAISDEGHLMWYVFTEGKEHGYHSSHSDPVAAAADAQDALARRSYVRKTHWVEIQALASDLRRGRTKMEVRLSDADASPLCSLGIRGFMRRFGLSNVTRVSGRLAGMLMMVEPQIGFVLFEAAKREGLLSGD